MSVVLPGGRPLLPWQSRTSDAVGATAVADAPAAAGAVTVPTVAVLSDPRHGPVAAAAVALALADACRQRVGIAAVVGRGSVTPFSLGAGARRSTAQLRERGYDAAPVGRLVWLADLRVSQRDRGDGERSETTVGRDPAAEDPVGAVAAASLELIGAARAVAAPAALAIPLARCAALDRVLGWHDAIVVVEDGRTTLPELVQLIAESLTALDRPVAAMPLPTRLHAAPAAAGLRAPAPAAAAVASLGLGART